MGGAASLAVDKVAATVGSVKAIPPYLDSEIKSLMLKVTFGCRIQQWQHLFENGRIVSILLQSLPSCLTPCQSQCLQQSNSPNLSQLLLRARAFADTFCRWAMRGRGCRRCQWWRGRYRRCSRPSIMRGTSTWMPTTPLSPPPPIPSVHFFCGVFWPFA